LDDIVVSMHIIRHTSWGAQLKAALKNACPAVLVLVPYLKVVVVFQPREHTGVGLHSLQLPQAREAAARRPGRLAIPYLIGENMQIARAPHGREITTSFDRTKFNEKRKLWR